MGMLLRHRSASLPFSVMHPPRWSLVVPVRFMFCNPIRVASGEGWCGKRFGCLEHLSRTLVCIHGDARLGTNVSDLLVVFEL